MKHVSTLKKIDWLLDMANSDLGSKPRTGITALMVLQTLKKIEAKSIYESVFVPLPDDIIANVIDWYNHLKLLGFINSDPLFSAIDNQFNQQNLLETNITNNPCTLCTNKKPRLLKCSKAKPGA